MGIYTIGVRGCVELLFEERFFIQKCFRKDCISEKPWCLSWEANEVRTDTEASTLASRDADRGREDVQDGKDGSSRDGNRQDLIKREALPGDKNKSQGNSNTFNHILNDTG